MNRSGLFSTQFVAGRLWFARLLLHRGPEGFGTKISVETKPIPGVGTALAYTLTSSKHIEAAIGKPVYGKGNELRLTSGHEAGALTNPASSLPTEVPPFGYIPVL
ncbi:hypothetical protein F4777DRAFT_575203 [Nemania sp. FL0916]|nr:hypothetical protein F4777DRAFT_575203 [Nemania sp. FL0916]